MQILGKFWLFCKYFSPIYNFWVFSTPPYLLDPLQLGRGEYRINHDTSSDSNLERLPESEFTTLLSRGKLSHPSADLYDLSQYLLCYFKMKDPKCCNSVFLNAFKIIYDATGYEFPNIGKIIRRFVNCFFKTFAKTRPIS